MSTIIGRPGDGARRDDAAEGETPGLTLPPGAVRPTINAPGAKPPNADDASLIKDGDTRSFMADVVEASREAVVLVDFWAPWCGPCKQLTPVLEKVVRGAGGAVRLVKVNVDENQQIAGQLGVQSIPAVFAFRDGRPVDGFMGALPESQLKQFVGRLIGGLGSSQAEEYLAAGAEAAAAGDHEGAMRAYAAAVEAEPGSAPALAGLAKALLALGDADAAAATLDQAPAEIAKSADIESARAAIALARQAGDPSTAAEMEARLADNPDDHEARWDLAMARLGGGDNRGAVDALLEIVRRDREWREDGARKRLVELFNALGPKDPATIEGRRRLSTVLFS